MTATRIEYRAYMASDEWKARRKDALDRATVPRMIGTFRARPAPRCEVCGQEGRAYKNSRSSLDTRERKYRVEGANGLEVHHLTYARLGAEHPDDLIVLCTANCPPYTDGCHEKAHKDKAFRSYVDGIAAGRS